MPSKVSTVVPVRVPNWLLHAMQAEIAKQNASRVEEDYTPNSWIVLAIQERIAKLHRSRGERFTPNKETTSEDDERNADGNEVL